MRFSPRTYGLPKVIEEKISSILNKKFSLDLSDSKKIATAVHTLSDYYIQLSQAQAPWETPWDKPWCQIAYLSYYFPLNYLRAKAVIEESKRLNFLAGIENLIDFGSGLGSATLDLAEYRNDISQTHIEKSNVAQELHRTLGGKGSWLHEPASIPSNTLGIFSYSLAETAQIPSWIAKCESLMLIEPATSLQGRKILQHRENLIKQNFYAWAPCTHQGHCPLLTQSKTDWCHDRIHFEQPDWFFEIEKHLPIKNKTLAMSYLLLSKRQPPNLTSAARIVGDLLKENGKSRQLVCHREKREFLTWMHRKIKVQEIPRGTLIQWPENLEEKSNELRLNEVIQEFQFPG